MSKPSAAASPGAGALCRLTWDLARRDIAARFRGSLLGILWLVLNPLFQLSIYYYVFSLVFKARWAMIRPDGQTLEPPSALVLFVGLIAFSFCSECLIRAPGLIRENPNYVKKVIFPLETLPLVACLSALFNAAVSVGLLFAFHLILIGLPGWQVVFVPLIFAALLLLTLGLVYGLAALGVYLPDLKNVMGAATLALMFLTPVVYPLSAVPEGLRPWILLNPLTVVVEDLRAVLFAQMPPDWPRLLALFAFAACVLALGFFGFHKLRKGFADVL
jgi:lipopolysaccharide transport system permease protein